MVVGKQAKKGRGLHFRRCDIRIFMSLMSMYFYVFLLYIMFAYLKVYKSDAHIVECASVICLPVCS
jgi:hypothetical protein